MRGGGGGKGCQLVGCWKGSGKVRGDEGFPGSGGG